MGMINNTDFKEYTKTPESKEENKTSVEPKEEK